MRSVVAVLALVVPSTLALGLTLSGCASKPVEGRESAGMPDRTTFPPVARVLLRRCGSLDCHGTKFRNFRLMGYGGLRLDPEHRPDAPDTTDDELDLDYDSLVGLEPTVMREVVARGGKDPEALTLVRKGRLAEAHKGGRRLDLGDDADRCLTSWLASDLDEAACKSAGGPVP